jgi:hypothetical protein
MDGLEQQAPAGDVTPPRPKTPRPIVAAALSLLQGGFGQVYSGRTWRGAAWFLVSDVAFAFIASGAVQVALRGMTDARRYYRVNGHSMLPLLADEDRVVGVVPE